MVAPDPGDNTADGCEEHTMNDPPPAAGVEPGATPDTESRPSQHAHVVEERGAVLDDRICWSTVGGLSLIHVAGFVGVIWIMLNPSAATLVLGAS